jgi:hypothetical protein
MWRYFQLLGSFKYVGEKPGGDSVCRLHGSHLCIQFSVIVGILVNLVFFLKYSLVGLTGFGGPNVLPPSSLMNDEGSLFHFSRSICCKAQMA